ncbi:hypothetical protein EDC01DRAFT_751079 [Geopyxis carbonaria]|nr:hypothetical protein EDC01DRAFT_751079 [Geopyxis carbonaria]
MGVSTLPTNYESHATHTSEASPIYEDSKDFSLNFSSMIVNPEPSEELIRRWDYTFAGLKNGPEQKIWAFSLFACLINEAKLCNPLVLVDQLMKLDLEKSARDPYEVDASSATESYIHELFSLKEQPGEVTELLRFKYRAPDRLIENISEFENSGYDMRSAAACRKRAEYILDATMAHIRALARSANYFEPIPAVYCAPSKELERKIQLEHPLTNKSHIVHGTADWAACWRPFDLARDSSLGVYCVFAKDSGNFKQARTQLVTYLAICGGASPNQYNGCITRGIVTDGTSFQFIKLQVPTGTLIKTGSSGWWNPAHCSKSRTTVPKRRLNLMLDF